MFKSFRKALFTIQFLVILFYLKQPTVCRMVGCFGGTHCVNGLTWKLMQKLFNDSLTENKKQKPTGFKCLNESQNILKTPHDYLKCQKSGKKKKEKDLGYRLILSKGTLTHFNAHIHDHLKLWGAISEEIMMFCLMQKFI